MTRKQHAEKGWLGGCIMGLMAGSILREGLPLWAIIVGIAGIAMVAFSVLAFRKSAREEDGEEFDRFARAVNVAQANSNLVKVLLDREKTTGLVAQRHVCAGCGSSPPRPIKTKALGDKQ